MSALVLSLPWGLESAPALLELPEEHYPLAKELRLPKIPLCLLETIVRDFRENLDSEAFSIIYWSRKKRVYYIARPDYEATRVSVKYSLPKSLLKSRDLPVLEIHSHNRMRAFFSPVDDEDEQGQGLYGVVGRLDCITPEVLLRLGKEDGTFENIALSRVFDLSAGVESVA